MLRSSSFRSRRPLYLAPQTHVKLQKGYTAKTKEYKAKRELQGKIVALATQLTRDAPGFLEGYVGEALRKYMYI
jgi:hypothetical protein